MSVGSPLGSQVYRKAPSQPGPQLQEPRRRPPPALTRAVTYDGTTIPRAGEAEP